MLRMRLLHLDSEPVSFMKITIFHSYVLYKLLPRSPLSPLHGEDVTNSVAEHGRVHSATPPIDGDIFHTLFY